MSSDDEILAATGERFKRSVRGTLHKAGVERLLEQDMDDFISDTDARSFDLRTVRMMHCWDETAGEVYSYLDGYRDALASELILSGKDGESVSPATTRRYMLAEYRACLAEEMYREADDD